jgi:hypothetical protein
MGTHASSSILILFCIERVCMGEMWYEWLSCMGQNLQECIGPCMLVYVSHDCLCLSSRCFVAILLTGLSSTPRQSLPPASAGHMAPKPAKQPAWLPATAGRLTQVRSGLANSSSAPLPPSAASA